MRDFKANIRKSLARKALVISMALHFILLIGMFYIAVINQAIPVFQDKIDAEISTIPKPPPSKLPIKKTIHQQRKPDVYEPAKNLLSRIEAITPQITFQPKLAENTPIFTAQPRLKQTDTTPDDTVDISTAVRELRQVEKGLSKTEAAQPTIGSTYGTKRSTELGVQRTSTRTILDVTGTLIDDDNVQTNIGDMQGNKPPLPKIPFSSVMKSLAREIAETSEGGPIDVVFVVDASGSMVDNINAVAKHLTDMIDVYKSSDLDYSLGLTEFSVRNKENIINIFQLTKNISEYKRNLLGIIPRGDEEALDAITQTIHELRFRATSKKHLILVTDEPLTSLNKTNVKNKITLKNTIALCREFGIYVNILGIDSMDHKMLAADTHGKWHAIPQNPRQITTGRLYTPRTAQTIGLSLRRANWNAVQKIGNTVLKNSGNSAIDIVLFIDGSKSMEDKLPQFLQQLDLWVRDWDNALIDYQIGVVRFRRRGSVNIVNVFNPPQSPEQVRKIVELPCQQDEDILSAVSEGLRRIKLRENAITHIIIVTDEPIPKNSSPGGTIQLLMEKHAVVSVIGTYDDFQQEVTIKTGGVWIPMPQGHRKSETFW